MKPIRERLDEALTIIDSVDRARALNEIAFEAEETAFGGLRGEAITILERIAALDPVDDLLDAAIANAHEHLVMLGVREEPALATIVAGLERDFGALPERERLIATATTLARAYGPQRPGAYAVAARLLDAASAIAPLKGKLVRLHDEVRAKAGATRGR